MEKKGIILKSKAGFYDVKDKETGEIVTCRGRGLFRKDEFVLLVGDEVTYTIEDDESATIMTVKDRVNQLTRPPIANVSKALLAFSAKNPAFNVKFLDRLLAVVEASNVQPVLIITKMDLITEEDAVELNPLFDYYRQIGYEVIETSIETGLNLDKIPALIDDNIVVLSGQSGVGKSSLLNYLDETLSLKVNEVSRSLGCGKHTTRHVELHPIAKGFIADTPGFSALEFDALEQEDLRDSFIEFRARAEGCRFRGCFHENEPKCAVKDALEAGEILQSRYDTYIQLLNDIKTRKVKY